MHVCQCCYVVYPCISQLVCVTYVARRVTSEYGSCASFIWTPIHLIHSNLRFLSPPLSNLSGYIESHLETFLPCNNQMIKRKILEVQSIFESQNLVPSHLILAFTFRTARLPSMAFEKALKKPSMQDFCSHPGVSLLLEIQEISSVLGVDHLLHSNGSDTASFQGHSGSFLSL